jgi:hypothetical protein
MYFSFLFKINKKITRSTETPLCARGNHGPLVNFIATSVEEALIKQLVIEVLETYTPREAAEHSPYSAEYLGFRARDGSLGANKDGRNWKVTGEDLEAYMAEVRKDKP